VAFTSNDQGTYLANLLPPGAYRVEVDAPGLQNVISNANVVTVDNVARVDVTLQPGTASQSVEVTGANPLVNTKGSSLGEVLSTHENQQLAPQRQGVFAAGTDRARIGGHRIRLQK
jgi:hypothetical protein